MRRIALAAVFLWCAGPAVAQISPGPLSKSHAGLEGSGQCLRCHEARKGVSAEKCLSCHTLLRERLNQGKGLHARPEYGDCKTCHIEHQGADFALVFWGKAGRTAFDHKETGYPLTGKHASLACETCHPGKLAVPKERRAELGLGPRSYLGLGTACRSCHADQHHGQFAGRECTACHGDRSWKPAAGFDHAQSAYPLTGLHLGVACAKCHPPLPGGEPRPLQYQGVAFKDCSSCHQDPHRGRFGASCSSCHQTAGWKRTDRGAFDHDKTRYPLRGRHAPLVCDRCHTPGKPLRLPFARCTDCHRDAHLGQFAGRADQGRCESCHDLTGFGPARYAIEEHQTTAYPLTGAHLAVACDACHRTLGGAALRRVPGVRGAAAGPAAQFRFASTRCADCHRNPHDGQVDRHLKAGGCESCHVTGSWREVRFDHAQTRFPLSGAHARPACAACHRRRATPGATPAPLQLTGVPLTCEGCHQDPHQGQFKAGGRSASCDRCHTTENLKATRFDHNRDAAYALDGAHARVPCAACHRAETRMGATFIRYKPLPTTCKGCHGASSGKEGTR